MKKKVIALIGRAGSGKSTIGKKFAEKHQCKYISTGDLARSMSDLSWEARGNLAPEDLIRQMVLDEIAVAKESVIILDGMPRIADQVYFLVDHFDDVQFVRIVCEEHEAIRRLKARGRTDDTESAINARMATYNANIVSITNVIDGFAQCGMIAPQAYVMSSPAENETLYQLEKQLGIAK